MAPKRSPKKKRSAPTTGPSTSSSTGPKATDSSTSVSQNPPLSDASGRAVSGSSATILPSASSGGPKAREPSVSGTIPGDGDHNVSKSADREDIKQERGPGRSHSGDSGSLEASSKKSTKLTPAPTKVPVIYGSKLHRELEGIKDDAFSSPPNAATGMPEGLASRSHTPKVSIGSRLGKPVAESLRTSHAPSSIPQELLDQEIFQEDQRPIVNPRPIVKPRAHQEAQRLSTGSVLSTSSEPLRLEPRLSLNKGSFSTASEPPRLEARQWSDDGQNLSAGSADTSSANQSRSKGKGKMAGNASDQDLATGVQGIDMGELFNASAEVIGQIPGFVLRENQLQTENKDAAIAAIDAEIATLDRKAEMNDELKKAFERSRSANEQVFKEKESQTSRLRPPLESMLHSQTLYNLIQKLEMKTLPDRQEVAIRQLIKVIESYLNQIEWRVEIMNKKHLMMCMQIALQSLNHKVLFIQYPIGVFRVYMEDSGPRSRTRDIESKRRHSFLQLLGTERWAGSTIPERIRHDASESVNLLTGKQTPRPWLLNATNAMMEIPEIAGFLDAGGSGGLLVVGCNISTHNEQWNDLTALAGRFLLDLAQKRATIFISHFSGRRNVDNRYKGVVGLLRSLCQQLVFEGPHIDYDFMDSWTDIKKAKMHSGDVETLCQVFRELLIEIAAVLKPKKHSHRSIILVIDSINNLEMPTYWDEFSVAVGCIRSVCEEIMLGDLGKRLTLKYIFLHNGVSRLVLDPHPLERVAAYELWKHLPH